MSFASLINQTVTIYNRNADPGGFDRYGSAIYTTGADYPARVQKVSRTMTRPDGEIVDINLLAFIRGDVSVQNDDKVVYSGTNYKVVGRDEMIGRDGSIHHLTLSLTDWSLS